MEEKKNERRKKKKKKYDWEKMPIYANMLFSIESKLWKVQMYLNTSKQGEKQRNQSETPNREIRYKRENDTAESGKKC